MKQNILFIGIVLAILLVMPVSGALNLTDKTGENYIKWTWDEPTFPLYMIYVDGIFIKNTTSQYYYLTDLQAMEEHRIDIYQYNPTKAAGGGTITSPDEIADLIASKTSSTTLNIGIYYLLMGILIIFTGMAGLIQNPVRGLLFGIMAIILAFVLGFLSAFFLDFLTVLSIIFGVLSVIFSALHVQQIMKNTYINFRFG